MKIMREGLVMTNAKVGERAIVQIELSEEEIKSLSDIKQLNEMERANEKEFRNH